MIDRAQLIARKNEVKREAAQIRRRIERARRASDPRQCRALKQLEAQLAQLSAEEYRLRLAIDRAK